MGRSGSGPCGESIVINFAAMAANLCDVNFPKSSADSLGRLNFCNSSTENCDGRVDTNPMIFCRTSKCHFAVASFYSFSCCHDSIMVFGPGEVITPEDVNTR